MFRQTESISPDEKPDLNRSLLRALSILKLFSPTSLELTVTEVSRRSGLPVATAFRILATLTQAGFLEKDQRSGKYRIGPETYMAGNLYLRTNDLLQAAGPVIRLVNELTEDVCGLSVLEKGYQLLLMREESRHTFRFAQTTGLGFPAYAISAGKALLSTMSEQELDELYPDEALPPLTANTITTKTQLKAALATARATGVAFNREESRLSVTSVAAVVRDAEGKPTAAVTVSYPTFRVNAEREQLYAGLIKAAAEVISHRLGYRQEGAHSENLDDLRAWWRKHGGNGAAPQAAPGQPRN
jgi:DNA-binding IclR family transcriptional regulator